MGIAVVYHSETGNTARVGGAIARAIGDEAILARLEEAPSLEDRGLVFVGMPLVKFGPPEAVRQFIEERCAGKQVALFVTHAAPTGLELLQPWLEACSKTASAADLVGFFHCQGQLAEPVRQYMLESGVPMLVQFAEMAACADGEPGEAALRRAADFARDVLRRTPLDLAGQTESAAV